MQEHIDKIKCRFDEFAEKAKFYINNPQEFFVDTLSILFKRDVGEDLKNIKNNIRNLIFGKPFSFERTNDLFFANKSTYVSSAGKTVSVVITEIFVCLDLQEIARRLDIIFDFDDLESYRKQKVDLYNKAKKKGWISNNNVWDFSKYTMKAASIISDILGESISEIFSKVFGWADYGVDVVYDLSGSYLSPIGGLIMAYWDTIVSLGIFTISGAIGISGHPLIGTLVGFLSGVAYDLLLKKFFENIAYNWYFDFL